MQAMMQVYVKGCAEAIELYKEAFDATLESIVLKENQSVLHAELSVNGQIIALADAEGERVPGNTMQFCFRCGPGNEEAVQKAYEVLKEGSEIIFPIGPRFYSPCCVDLIDKFGVRWCIFVVY